MKKPRKKREFLHFTLKQGSLHRFKFNVTKRAGSFIVCDVEVDGDYKRVFISLKLIKKEWNNWNPDYMLQGYVGEDLSRNYYYILHSMATLSFDDNLINDSLSELNAFIRSINYNVLIDYPIKKKLKIALFDALVKIYQKRQEHMTKILDYVVKVKQTANQYQQEAEKTSKKLKTH